MHDHLLATYQIYHDISGPHFFHAASEAQKRNWERKVELAGCPRSTAAVPIITLSTNAMGDISIIFGVITNGYYNGLSIVVIIDLFTIFYYAHIIPEKTYFEL